MPKESKTRAPNRYAAIIERVFDDHYKKGAKEFAFTKTEFEEVAKELGIKLPKNTPDIIYSFRYRNEFPERILNTPADNYEWVIKGTGKGMYKFRQVKLSRIIPRDDLLPIKIPDATPEIIAYNAFGDEQALLAKVRYNRLIDIFLGITTYSLQNHLRSTVEGTQIEIDELYVGIDRSGRQFIIPVQAKRGSDKLGSVQTEQDIDWCKKSLPNLICRPVSVQFMDDKRIAMFELVISDEQLMVVGEKHYQLVMASEITPEDIANYSLRND